MLRFVITFATLLHYADAVAQVPVVLVRGLPRNTVYADGKNLATVSNLPKGATREAIKKSNASPIKGRLMK